MKIMPCTFQKTEAIIFPTERWSFGRFGGFSVTLQTAYWTQTYDNEPSFRPSSQNVEKSLLNYAATTPNQLLNHQRAAVFGRQSANAAPIAPIVFSSPKHRVKCISPVLLRCLRLQLTRATSLYDQNDSMHLLYDFRIRSLFWPSRARCVFGACTTHFKFTKPPINCCSWRSRCGITFLQPFQWLFRSFSHQKTMFDQDAIFLFFHFFYEGESAT